MLTTFLVDSTADAGAGTLRQAILDANASAGADDIEFDIAGAGPHTIQPLSNLPTITDPVIIDGYSQVGASQNSLLIGSNASIEIVLDGTAIGAGGVGLDVDASNTVIRGLALKNFGSGDTSDGTLIDVATATSNVTISGNHLGRVDAQAETITILSSARAGDITDGDGDDDLNAFYQGEGFTSSLLSGTVTSASLANVDLLVVMLPDDAFTGAEIATMQDHLSGGGRILFMGEQQGFAATENGFINSALSALGSSMALGTASIDVGFNDTTAGQILPHPFNAGVSDVNYGNVNSISGILPGNELFLAKNLTTAWGGVEYIGGGTIILLADTNMLSHIEDTAGNDNHQFFANVTTLAHGSHRGVLVNGGSGHVIGGSTPGDRNVISDNGTGILITGASSNVKVAGNYIGTDAAGTGDLGNTGHGISVLNASATIGGEVSGAGNVISGNIGDGVHIEGESTVSQSLVSWWRAEGDATDFVGSNDGTLLNGTTFAAGQNGQGFSFDGVDDVVEVSPPGPLAITGDVTVDFWFQRNTASAPSAQQNLVGQGAGTDFGVDVPSSYTTGIFGGTGELFAGFETANGSNVLLTGPAILDSAFHHLVYVREGTAHRLLLDGVEVASATFAEGPGDSSGFPFTIGGAEHQGEPGFFFEGRIDEVAVYDRGLSEQEIAGLFAAGGAVKGGSVVQGNYIGTDAAGTGDVGNATHGISIANASRNIIGGTTAAERNVISGNTQQGVEIDGSTATGNVLLGNYIGVDVTGDADLGNDGHGIRNWLDATGNTIGGASAGAGNVISGNAFAGITLGELTDAGSNLVEGNIIGLNADGDTAIPNSTGSGSGGIAISSSNNTIRGNVISGNQFQGIYLTSLNDLANDNIIVGNIIGPDATGLASVGASGRGILIAQGAHDNIIGGTGPDDGNVISGNSDGILVDAVTATGTVIQGNYVGLGIDGTTSIPNLFEGVWINDTSATIGGDIAGAGNVISANGRNGVRIEGIGNGLLDGITNWYRAENDATDFVGDNDGALQNGATFTTGQFGQAFDLDGVDDFVEIPSSDAFNSDSLTVEAWVNPDDISSIGNIATKYDTQDLGQGISWAFQADAGGGLSFTVYQSNSHGAGTVFTGAVADMPVLSTGSWQHVAATFDLATNRTRLYVNGVEVSSSPTPGSQPVAFLHDSNTPVRLGTIRTTSAGGLTGFFEGGIDEFAFYDRALTRQEIAGLFAGMGLAKGGSVVQGNIIGLDATGAVDRGNGGDGIEIFNSPLNVIGGSTAGARNIIATNAGQGVHVNAANSVGNFIQANYIGTNAAGTTDFGNSGAGVLLNTSASNNTIGTDGDGVGDEAERNVISGNLGDGVRISGGATTQNVVAGNLIGTDVTGASPLGNLQHGVNILDTASHNVIGTDGDGVADVDERNVISGNGLHGVQIVHSGTDQNVVAGNYIGTDVTGSLDLGNTFDGVAIWQGAQSNRIGTDGSNDAFNASERNVISGNDRYGVQFVNSGTNNNLVAGNYIGTNAAGTAGLGNSADGVRIIQGATANIIGTDGDGVADSDEGNVISANLLTGVWIANPGTDSNIVAGNMIGTDVTGASPLGNLQHGVNIQDTASHNVIGTDGDGVADVDERNVISDNGLHGVQIVHSGTDQNVVAGNYIGTDVTGSLDLGNAADGIAIWQGAQFNRIGTDGSNDAFNANERNVISGNDGNGVHIVDSGTSQNVVAGNYLGTDASGIVALGNGNHGVIIRVGASNNLIGGSDSTARNVISANAFDGIRIRDAGSDGNRVQGNYIGTDKTGAVALGNLQQGVNIFDTASHNIIGTDGDGAGDANEGNVIASNQFNGVSIAGAGTSFNVVAGNLVGTDATGMLALGNTFNGVTIGSGATNNRVGTDADGVSDILERNVLSANSSGVLIQAVGTDQNVVAGNLIGTDIFGTTAIANLIDGIRIQTGGSNNTIGIRGDETDPAAARNVISGNLRIGVQLQNAESVNNVVAGNLIGTDITGSSALGNAIGVNVTGGTSGNVVGTNTDGFADGLEGNVISGNQSHGVAILGAGTESNVVAGNYLGTDVNGAVGVGNGTYGVVIFSGAAHNLIGGSSAVDRNVISGNTFDGVRIRDAGTDGNRVQGNYIGTDATGTLALGNLGQGVFIFASASGNLIGADGDGLNDAAERNIISGNAANGIVISDAGTSNNIIAGNYIGADVTGAVALGNGTGFGHAGVRIQGGATQNLIGTNADGLSDEAERNVISGSAVGNGVYIVGPGTEQNTVAGNYIGTDASGMNPLGNRHQGIRIENAANNVAGGTNASARNVVSGNRSSGIALLGAGAAGNQILGNVIGLAADGATPLGNLARTGVLIIDAPSNSIGGGAPGAGNTISANQGNGVTIDGSGASGNEVAGNYIGTDVTGMIDLGNGNNGVLISDGASSNRIGTDGDGVADAAERNVIAGNTDTFTEANINIIGIGTDQNVVAGNYIGTNAAGTAGLTTVGRGVRIASGAAFNIIGTDGSNDAFNANERNVVSGHSSEGIFLAGGSNDNTVAGNWVGLDISGTIAIGNSGAGISVSGSQRTRIGTNADGIADALERNVVVGSGGWGVQIADSGAEDNIVAGNFIGTNPTGTIAMSNGSGGVGIANGAIANVIGGTDPGTGNLISGNNGPGVGVVRVFLGMTLLPSPDNVIQGNLIGTDVSGTLDLGNTGEGILIEEFNTTVGGATAAARNIISGNDSHGILITDATATGNVVEGNFIGTDVTGNVDLGNTGHGVRINNSASNNTIGGTTAGTGNVISGNDDHGVQIRDADGNTVAGNIIGLNAAGTSDLGNAEDGVGIDLGSSNNTIGGTVPAARNVISGNDAAGVILRNDGTSNNVVIGNLIGTDITGTVAIGNFETGVTIINGSTLNRIGGPTASERNIIAGNTAGGVRISSANTSNNFVQGNFIGLDANGAALGNDNRGIYVFGGAHDITIGGGAPGEGNVISANAGAGIEIDDSDGNVLQGNIIGLNATGSLEFGNETHGVLILNGASDITIGGTTAGERNVISGNAADGIRIGDGASSATDVTIIGNYIGTDVSGTLGRGNADFGIQLIDGDNVQIGGGGSGAGNVISGNAQSGIAILPDSVGTVVQGNRIGTDRTGTAALGNGVGIVTHQAAIIGTDEDDTQDAAERNIIAHNTDDGVAIIDGSLAGGVTIRRNLIHSNGGLGIDFGDDGVTFNDDTDGAQDFPVIISAFGGADTQIIGTITGVPGSTVILDFFADTVVDASGFGEGRRYLGTHIVPLKAAGSATFEHTFDDIATIRGEHITATATAADGATSEFSLAFETTFAQPPTITEENLIVTALDDSGDGQVAAFGLVTQVVPENTDFRLDGLFESPDLDDEHTVTVDWGDGTSETVVVEAGIRGFSFEHRYDDDTLSGTPSDDFTVFVIVTESDGASGSASIDITVENVAPTLAGDLVLVPTAIDEGETVELSGALVDPGLLDTHTVTVDWGDGSPVSSLFLAAGVTEFDFSHTYQDDNQPAATPITVTLTDDDTGQTVVETSLDVANVAPVASILGAGVTVLEGDTVSLTAAVTDAGIGDTHTYEWSAMVAGDVVATGTAQTFEFVPPDSGDYTVSLVVTDDDGGVSGTETVMLPVLNVAPTIEPGDLSFRDEDENPVAGVDEGAPIRLNGTFADPGIETHTIVIDWGDDGPTDSLMLPAGVTSFSIAHVYLDDPAAGTGSDFPVTVTVTDKDLAFDDAEIPVTVGNLDPDPRIVDNGSDATTIRLAATVDDAGTDTFIFLWAVTGADLPDGTPTDQPTISFPRPTDGVAAVSLTVTDDDGGATQTEILVVAGTDEADVITVAPTDDPLDDPEALQVTVANATNGEQNDFVAPVDAILITSGASNDVITIHAAITAPANVLAGDGDDSISSGSGDDLLEGGAGNDTVFAGAGDDTITSIGDDDLAGGTGNDSYVIQGFSDKILREDGGDGTDTIDFAAVDQGVTLDLSTTDTEQTATAEGDTVTLTGDFENLIGSDFDDSFTGNQQENLIISGEGNDLIFDGGGNDSFMGGGGDDSIMGGEGNDVYEGGDGNDTVMSGEGSDTTFIDGDDTIFGGEGNDLIFDGEGNDSFMGGGGDDSIMGGGGNDIYDGGMGNDTITSGGGSDPTMIDGDDTIFGGEGNDLIFDGEGNDSFAGGGGDDSIMGGGGNDIYDGGDGNDTIMSGDGSDPTMIDGDDTIFGGEGNDLIFDGEGNDSFSGGGGDDTIIGGEGNDVYDGGDGNDTIMSGGGNDTTFADGDDTIFGGEGNDLIFDGEGNDSFSGGGGDDSIIGGEGNDIYDGGMGNDTIMSGGGSDPTIIDGDDTIFGGEGNDLIFDGEGNDSYSGGGGDDTIISGGGNDTTTSSGDDTIFGGDGNDLIFDGEGNDSFMGGGGDDSIIGGAGNDVYDGGDGNDTIISGDGNDTTFSDGDDTIFGGEGNDLIFDGEGNDSFMGGGGDDSIIGGEGNDVYDGGEGNDTINSGDGNDSMFSDGDDTIFGGEGNDLIFDGEGNDSFMGGGGDDTIMGGDGNDVYEGGDGNDLVMGADGNDTLDGGTGNDTLNAGDGEETIFGGEGNDLIFGGAQSRLIDAGTGNDVIQSRSVAGAQTQILGNAGSDTIVSGAGDEVVFGGAGDEDWLIESADTDMVLDDATLSANGVTTHSEFERVQLIGGDGDNLLDASAFSGDAVLIGGLGNDTLLAGSGDDTLNGGGGDDSLVGGAGDDTYQFDAASDGSDTIVEDEVVVDEGGATLAATAGSGSDMLDFGRFPQAVTIDLAMSGQQAVAGNLSLTISNPQSLEDVTGTAFSDQIFGNDLDNKLFGGGGADDLQGGAGNDLVQASVTKRVFLDFDSQTQEGEHVYTTDERNAIEQRLAADFADFDFEFTQTEPADGAFVTVWFNAAPLFNGVPRPGGRASQLGWRMVELSGIVIIDVNGFLGPGNGLAPTSQNFVALSATIAAHELGHQFGLRHHDSFGNLGSGIYSKLDPARFLPDYPGLTEADQTRLHLSASPGSVGTSLVDAAGNPFFGERERIKLAFAETGTSIVEVDPTLESPQIVIDGVAHSAQDLELAMISVPIQGEDRAVAALNVEGRIELTADGIAESDFYAIQAEAGDLLTVEVLSASLQRIGESIDSMLRIYNAAGDKLDYYGNVLGAFNDDNLELTDSILLDVVLPEAGTYFIEVDTFRFRSPEFATYVPDFDVEAFEEAFSQHPGVADDDVGDYELFLYRSSPDLAGQEATGDTLSGGAGEDTLIGSSGRDEIFGFNFAEDELIDRGGAATFRAGRLSISLNRTTINEGESVTLSGRFDGGAESIVVDWGDGTGTQSVEWVNGIFSVSHTYGDDQPGAMPDLFTLMVTLTDQGETLTAEAAVGVRNLAPQDVDAGENRIQVFEGRPASFTAEFEDVAADAITIAWSAFGPDGTLLKESSESAFEFTPLQDGLYRIQLTVSDDDGGQGTDFVEVFVQNGPPQNVSGGEDLTVVEGDLVQLTATFQDSPADTHSFLWQVSTDNGQVIADGHEADFEFVPADDGVYSVLLTVTDNDGGRSSDFILVTSQNAPPQNVHVLGELTVDENETVELTAAFDDVAADTHTFRWQVSSDNGQIIGDGQSQNFSFTPNDNGLYTVTLTVTDDDGGSASNTVIVTVLNVPPVLTIEGPASGVRWQERSFIFTAFDQSDPIEEFQIDWDGDGSVDQIVAAPGPVLEISHIYDSIGLFSIRATATDEDGGVSEVAVHEIDIRYVDVQVDPWNENALAVLVGGTDFDDAIDFVALGETGVTADIRTSTPEGKLTVTADVAPTATGFQMTTTLPDGTVSVVDIAGDAAIERLVAFGRDGDDTIRVSSQLAIDSLLFGDAGRDIVVGGSGDNVILGGDGDDALFGGAGRDILIGGRGADRLMSQGEEDLLIGGFLNFENFTDRNRILRNIADIWNDRNVDYADRVAALSDPAAEDALIEGQTLFNDGDRDILNGGQDLDWFLGNEEEDRFHASLDEIFTGIDESLLDI